MNLQSPRSSINLRGTMGKPPRHSVPIQTNYSLYLDLLRVRKTTTSCPLALAQKRNFPRYLAGEVEALTETQSKLGLRAEKNSATPHYELKLFARSICPEPILRFESDGPSHENRFDYIPLPERIVSTPHFHRYNEDGFEVAFKTDLLEDEPKVATLVQDINAGLEHFSKEANVRCTCNAAQGSYPRTEQEQSDLLPPSQTDPHAGLPI